MLKRDIPLAPGMTIAKVKLTHCRNGYARVVLVPAPAGVTDDLPVFLVKTDKGWSIVDAGTGIDCSHEETLVPKTMAACRALGVVE